MAPNQRHPPEQATKTHTKSRVLKKLILRQDCNSGSGSTVKDVKTSSWKQKKLLEALGENLPVSQAAGSLSGPSTQ